MALVSKVLENLAAESKVRSYGEGEENFEKSGATSNKDRNTVPEYSRVKDSNEDLGVIFRFLQNYPITKAVCTKISKTFFCIFSNILIFLRENKDALFSIF